SDQVGSGPNLPGLVTTPVALPASVAGLAGQIAINPSVDPNQGGNPIFLRDGGICGNPTIPTTQLATPATKADCLSCLPICPRQPHSAPPVALPPLQLSMVMQPPR